MTTVPLTSGQRISAGLAAQRRYIPVLGTLVLLVVMFAVGASRYDYFLTGQTIANIFYEQSALLVIAVGMTFVILTGGIDLSVGSLMALSTVLIAKLVGDGWSPAVVIPVVLVGGVLLGAAMGAVIHYFEIQPFIVTLAGMFFARGLSQMISQESIPINNHFLTDTATTKIVLGPDVYTRPIVFVALLAVGVAFYVLHYRRLGRNVYAVGGNEQSALLMGLPVARTKITVYAISGFCAALAGVLFSIYITSGYNQHGVGFELDAIAAVVIGGTLLTGGSGYVLGTLLGVLVFGVIQTLVNFQGNLSSWWTRIVIGVLLFLFIVLQRIIASSGAKRRA